MDLTCALETSAPLSLVAVGAIVRDRHLRRPFQQFVDRLIRPELARSVPVQLLIIVEGVSDIAFLEHLSSVLHAEHHEVPNLRRLVSAGRIVFVPTGGGDLRPWTDRFAFLQHREFHLFDREVQPVTAEREAAIATVNGRSGCQAMLTRKRAIENYLHPAAIREGLGLDVQFSDCDDVSEVVARKTIESREGCWDDIPSRGRRRLRQRAKQRLHRYAVPRMTAALLGESDPQGEVRGWLTRIAQLLEA